MSTLNARANQAWVDARDPDTGFSPFPHQRAAFEEGWETGYKTAAKEIAEAIAAAFEAYPGNGGIHHSVAARLAREIGRVS